MTRTRLVKTFSFQDRDARVLRTCQARLSRILPEVTESETVRLALHLLEKTPSAVLSTVAQEVARLKPGRPRSLTGLSLELKRLIEEDESRSERIQVLEEISSLEEQEGMAERLATLYERLGMLPVLGRVKS
jgi:hypothetical protein